MRKFLALAGAVALSSAWAVMPASAGALGFSVSPGQGPVGTVITVSGSGCQGDDVMVKLVHEEQFVTGDTFNTSGSDWSGTLTVPDDAVAGEDQVTAFCDLGDDEGFNYTPGSFEVTVVEQATTTTVAPTTTTTVVTQPTIVPTPVVVQAPPAAPVVAQPVTAG